MSRFPPCTPRTTAIIDDCTVWQTMKTTTSQPEQAQPTDMVPVNTVARRKTPIARHDGSDQQRVFPTREATFPINIPNHMERSQPTATSIHPDLATC